MTERTVAHGRSQRRGQGRARVRAAARPCLFPEWRNDRSRCKCNVKEGIGSGEESDV